MPGGKDRSVTSSSRLEYIHRVANYKLNYQPRRASDAFRTGLEKVIPHEWLRMFSEVELQVCQPLRQLALADTVCNCLCVTGVQLGKDYMEAFGRASVFARGYEGSLSGRPEG